MGTDEQPIDLGLIETTADNSREDLQLEEVFLSAAERAKLGMKNYGLSFNLVAGGDHYAPSRDFARNYPRMIEMVIGCFSSRYWPKLMDLHWQLYCLEQGTDWTNMSEQEREKSQDEAFDALERCKDTYCNFLQEACEDKRQGCTQALVNVGWGDVDHASKIAWLAMLGEVVSGQIYQGIRDLQREPGEVPADFAQLLKGGHEMRQFDNGIDGASEAKLDRQREMRNGVRKLRAAGFSFDELRELVADVEFGRVPIDE